jgi:hypothetical protein
MASAIERERLRVEADSEPTDEGPNWATVCKACGFAAELRSGYSWPRCPSCGGILTGVDAAGERVIEPWGEASGRRRVTLEDLHRGAAP